MTGNRIAITLCGALAAAACSIGRPLPEATTYLVDPPADVTVRGVMERPEALRIGTVRVAAPYADTALVYRLDDVQYISDPYHAFAADPGAMLASRMAIWLDQCGLFSSVAQPGSTRSAPYVLEATVTELYGDFRGSRPPAAVLAVQFTLIEQAGTRPKVVYERTLARRVELPKARPDTLVRGYGTALGEILSQLAPEIRAATLL
jgi:cholesterol transport system auxiliary component